MNSLSGKTILVTGAAQGIGLALARQAATENMNVVMTDIDEQVLLAAAKDVGQSSHKVLPLAMGVSKSKDWAKVLDAAHTACGNIHVLINNAGILGVPNVTWRQSEQDWGHALGVNLQGVINGVQFLIPHMLEHGEESHIVNVASVAGHVVQPFMAPYHVTKFGVTALTESIYHELDIVGADIGVSLVCPGFTKTNILSGDKLPPLEEGDGQMQHIRDAFTTGVNGGISADEVAVQTFEAIKTRKFYVFTNPGTIDFAAKRFWQIVREEKPDLGDALRARFVPS